MLSPDDTDSDRRSDRGSRISRDEAAAIAELEQYNPENPENVAFKEDHIATVGNEANGGFHNMLADRINPHELSDSKREEYLTNLWNAFTAKSTNGTVTEDDILDIAIMLNVDCTEENLLDLIDATPEEIDFDFTTLTDLLDRASEMEADKYREMDVDRLGSANEILLNPLQYLWYKTPCASKKPNTAYRLHSKYRVEIKPRMSLLLTTGFFMLLIGAVLLALIAILWRENRFSTEEILVTNLRRTMFELSSLYELFFYDQHEDELMDQVRIVGDMMNLFFVHDLSNQERKMKFLQGMMGSENKMIKDHEILKATSTHADYVSDAISQLGSFGVKFNTKSLADYVSTEGLAMDLAYRSAGVNASSGRSNTCDSNAGEFRVVNGNAGIPSGVNDLCFSNPSSKSLKERRRERTSQLLEKVNSKMRERFENSSGTARSYVPVSVTLLDTDHDSFPSAAANQSCYNLDLDNTCSAFMAQTKTNSSGRVTAFNEEVQLYNTLPLDGVGASVVVTAPYEEFLLFRQQILIDSVNYLNFQFVRTTEVVLSRLNKTNGEFVSQATLFRFDDGCYMDECDRIAPAQRNTIKSFETQKDSRMITPDYRPEPVAGASRWLGAAEMVLIMERDVQEVRGLGLESLASIIDNVNSENKGSTEIELFHIEGRPYMRDFDPRVPCTENEDCISTEKDGVIFRFDCVHCQRVDAIEQNASVKFLTKRKKGATATTGTTDGTSKTAATEAPTTDTAAEAARIAEEDNTRDSIYRNTLFNRKNYGGRFTDYDGAQVIGESDYIWNYSVGVLTKVDYSEINDPLMKDIWTSTGSAVGFLLAGVIILLLLSNHSLNQIESDWVTSKAKIEADKQRFGEMVSELIPANLAERMMKAQSFISETTNASIIFADVCGFSENVSQLTPKHIIRYISYVFQVLETVSESCRMSRLCSLGDTFAVYSTDLSEAEQAALEETSKPKHKFTPSIRGVKYAAVAAELCSSQFAHFPERAKHFKDAFKDRLRSTDPFEFPRIRFGGHTGTSICGIVDTGKAPKFDFFGISAALASRMCATGQPQTVHVTSMMKEAIEQDVLDVPLVDFDEPRKTIVRGQGTITSFFLKSSAFEVADNILNKLGVQRASAMQSLENLVEKRDDRSSSLSSRPSFHSSSDR